MEQYTTVACVLGLAFGTLLAVVIILIINLRKRYPKKYTALSKPNFLTTPGKKPSLAHFQSNRVIDLIPESEEEEVFEHTALKPSQISFSLFHIPSDERLVLDVWSVVDSPSNFITGFVEAQLFPSDFEPGQFRTNVRESVDNAVIFNESFVIPDVSEEVLTRVYLKLFLYAVDDVRGPECVGHAVFSLPDVKLNPMGKTQFKQELIQHKRAECSRAITDEESPPSPSRDKGKLYISLRYQKKSGRINVVVLKGENMQKGKVLPNDSYVKIKLLYQGEVIEKKQTKAKKRSSSPCWNEPFVFNVDEEKGLNNYELIFLVRRRDLISPHSSVGFVRIGPQVGGAGRSHWYAMLAKGNLMRQVARRHKIE